MAPRHCKPGNNNILNSHNDVDTSLVIFRFTHIHWAFDPQSPAGKETRTSYNACIVNPNKILRLSELFNATLHVSPLFYRVFPPTQHKTHTHDGAAIAIDLNKYVAQSSPLQFTSDDDAILNIVFIEKMRETSCSATLL